MTIQANQGPGVSIFGATSAGGGGSTSPGGSSGQVQYNNGGSFGGMSGTTWTDASQSLAIASTGTGTGVTSSTPVLNLSQTWNAGAVTFTGLKFNATDTASASGSLLLDLQVGAASKFSVDKSGNMTAVTLNLSNGQRIYSSGSGFYFRPVSGNVYVEMPDLAANPLRLTGPLGFTSATGVNSDLILSRANTATLQLGAADAAAPVAQTLQVQSVVAGTSNTAGTNWTLKGSAGTGTGAGGSIIFQVAAAGSSGTAQNAYATALTIASDQSATFAGIIIASGNKIYLPDINNNFEYVSSAIATKVAGVTPMAAVSGGLQINGSKYIAWCSGNPYATSADTFLYRDTANTLALRNSTNAQTFNAYITYTDASNYQRVVTGYDSVNAIYGIGMVGAGTGLAASSLEIANQLGGIYFRTGNLAAGTRRWNITNGGDFLAVADNTYDIGASGASRPRNLYTSKSVSCGGVTYANLPTGIAGMISYVTDGSAASYAVGDTVSAGGGSAKVMVYYTGAAWKALTASF